MGYLFEEIDSAKLNFGISKDIPSLVTDNLSRNIKLRPYQKNCFENTLIYLETPKLRKNKQTHLLYHMATGSGKTVIMAMNILYFYSLGYRNFLFFTNQTNIITKTKENFLNQVSIKYLFNSKITINGSTIKIKEVQNFQSSDPSAINICFNTVQGIMSSLSIVKEGMLTLDDFSDNRVVLIADEAHHLNSLTKSDKVELEENVSWESTINNIFRVNTDNVLLEFTATCDLKDVNVNSKYLDKIVFNYRLKEFREDGYTKEFANLQSSNTKFGRTLQALIMSEFRKLLFSEKNIPIQPVVLLKSKIINESNLFYDEFYLSLNALSVAQLEKIRDENKNEFYFKSAFDYFKSKEISLDALVDLIKLDFAKEHSVNMNSFGGDNERIVNNLDEKSNHYRLIFIVDKLTEGWDVLSLFDIVRLYETRQGSGVKGVVSKYTISEAQLIGRGARYCPFKFEPSQETDKRKYHGLLIEESICETLLYHCMSDSSYISELKQALKETGLIAPTPTTTIEYKLKDTFKETKVYKQGFVFLNEKREKKRDMINSLPDNIRNSIFAYKCKNSASRSSFLLEEGTLGNDENLESLTPVKFKDLGLNILFKAFRCLDLTLSFKRLKQQFPNLKSSEEFLTSNYYCGNMQVVFTIIKGQNPTFEDKLGASKKVLQFVSDVVQKIEVFYEGTEEFIAYPIREKFTNRLRNITRDPSDESWGEGVSQNDILVDNRFRMELSTQDWFAYADNFGTSEEKKFVKYFSSLIEDLKKHFDEVYLIRNELQIAIYSFDSGSKFEPDYLMILYKKGMGKKNLYINIFVEPKGAHLLEKDKGKGDFLIELSRRAIPIVKFVDDNKYSIWGTPLYNEIETKTEFDDFFKDAVKSMVS